MGGFSLAVKDQKASAFADDVDATITRARFVDDFDYDGQREAVVAARIEFTVDGADEPFVNHYTLGDALQPCNDGLGLEPVPGKEVAGLKSNTNFGKFLASLVSSGFDDELLTQNDISVIEDLHVHLIAEARKLSKKEEKEGRKPSSVILVNQIHEEPYKAAKGAKPAAKPAAGKAAPAAKAAPAKAGKSKADPVKEAADAAVLGVLEAAGGSIAASKLSTPVFKACKSDPNVKKIVALAISDEYLSADDAVFDYDGTTLSLKSE